MRKPSAVLLIKPAKPVIPLAAQVKRAKRTTPNKKLLLAGYMEARKKLVAEIELLTKRADAAAAGLKKIQEKIDSLN